MKIYSAAKIWHAPKFQDLRDNGGYDINARWIDYDAEHPIVQQKAVLWQHCLEDVVSADFMVIYCEDPAEEMRGVIMEAGHAMAAGKNIYCINTTDSFSPCPISDVAFTHHPQWHFIREESGLVSVEEGFQEAFLQQTIALGVVEMPANVYTLHNN